MSLLYEYMSHNQKNEIYPYNFVYYVNDMKTNMQNHVMHKIADLVTYLIVCNVTLTKIPEYKFGVKMYEYA